MGMDQANYGLFLQPPCPCSQTLKLGGSTCCMPYSNTKTSLVHILAFDCRWEDLAFYMFEGLQEVKYKVK